MHNSNGISITTFDVMDVFVVWYTCIYDQYPTLIKLEMQVTMTVVKNELILGV